MDARIKWLRVAIGVNVLVLLLGCDDPLVDALIARLGALLGSGSRAVEWTLLLWPYALAALLVLLGVSLRHGRGPTAPGTRGTPWIAPWGRRGHGVHAQGA